MPYGVAPRRWPPSLAAALVFALALAGCGPAAGGAAPRPAVAKPAAAKSGAKPVAKAARGAPPAHGPASGAPLKGVVVPLPALPTSAARSAVRVVPVAVTAAVKRPKPPAPPKTVRLPVPAVTAARFSAYRVGLPGGLTYLLGPKGMHGSGTIAADGSFQVTLTGPGPHEILHVWSDGGCVGCSVQSAAAFFASARKAAAAYGGFHGATIEQFGARVARPDPQTALFSYALSGGVEAKGLAFYAPRGGRGLPFVAAVVLAPASVQRLTPWILGDLRAQLG